MYGATDLGLCITTPKSLIAIADGRSGIGRSSVRRELKTQPPFGAGESGSVEGGPFSGKGHQRKMIYPVVADLAA